MTSLLFATLLTLLAQLALLPNAIASPSSVAYRDAPSRAESAFRRDESGSVSILGFEQVSESMGVSAQMVR